MITVNLNAFPVFIKDMKKRGIYGINSSIAFKERLTETYQLDVTTEPGTLLGTVIMTDAVYTWFVLRWA